MAAGSDPKNIAPQGLGVDASGGPVVDPTANVIALVNAEAKRLDELRIAENRRIEELRKAGEERTNDLRAAESRRVDEQAVLRAEQVGLRAEFQEKLQVAEAKRIDAIRAVDVAAVATASERAAQQANVLASQLTASTETLRAAAATQATAIAQQLQNTITPIVDKIGKLEQAQYESKGKSGVADPQMDLLVKTVADLARVQTTAGGEKQGGSDMLKVIMAIGLFLIAILGYLAVRPH